MDAGADSNRHTLALNAPGVPLGRSWSHVFVRTGRQRPRTATAKAFLYASIVLTVAAAVAVLNALWLSSVNPWVLVTAPLNAGHRTNSIIGYSWLLDGAPIHKENVSPLLQSLSFGGVFAYPDGYFLRPLYPFLISVTSWFMGLKAAALSVNFIAYGIWVVATGWLAYGLTRQRRAAYIAGLFAAVGTGSIIHLNDISAHMLAYATYALVTCVIFASDVWRTCRGLRVHLALGIALALASLAYPSGFLLTLGYVLVSLRTSRLRHVALASAIGISARFVWEYVLNAGYRIFFASGPYDIYSNDFGAAKWISINYWMDMLRTDPMALPAAIGRPLFDSVFVAFPIVTLLGFAGVLLIHRRAPARLWFCSVFLVLPYLGLVFFSPGAGARGYLVYSSAFMLFASIPALVYARSEAASRRLGPSLMLGSLIAAQAAWSTAHLFGYYFPAVSFYIGFFSGIDPFTRTDVVNLSGSAPLWRFYGGPADFVGAGGLALGSIVSSAQHVRSIGFSLLTNGFILALVVAAAGTALGRRPVEALAGPARRPKAFRARARPAFGSGAGSYVGAWLSACLLVSGLVHMQKQSVQPFSPEQNTPFPGERPVSMTVDLSPDAGAKFLGELRARPDLRVHLFARGSGLVSGRIALGDREVASRPIPTYAGTLLWQLDGQAVSDALSSGRNSLTLQLLLRDGMLAGWQRAPAAGRTLEPRLEAGQTDYFPSLELRLVDEARNTTVLIGY